MSRDRWSDESMCKIQKAISQETPDPRALARLKGINKMLEKKI